MHKVQSKILGSKLKPEVKSSGQAQLFFFFKEVLQKRKQFAN